MKTAKWNRVLHRWGAAVIALPVIIVVVTGVMLQLKSSVSTFVRPEVWLLTHSKLPENLGMTVVKKVILTSFALLLPVTATGDFAVKFFPGWSYRHQDDEIHDGATLWAVIKQGDSYVLTKRKIRLESVHSKIRDDEGQASGRELIATDRESSIIHFTGIDNLKSGPIFLKEIKKPLLNTFNPKVPPSSVDFEIKDKIYTVFVKEVGQYTDGE